MKKSLVLISIILLLSFGGVLYSQKESDAFVPALRYVPKSMLAWILAEPFRPEFYTQESSPTDWTDAIEAAGRAAMEQNGNTVKFACGQSYHIARKLNFDGAQQIVFLACASDYEQQGKRATITYSGTDKQGLSFRSSHGITLERLKIECSNPLFTGECVSFTHSDHNREADSAYFNIKYSTITGTPEANQSTLLAIDGSIIGRIEANHFFHSKVGIRGMSAEYGNYSNVITVAENSFNAVDVGILNPSSNWNITTNTFEPNKEGKLRAVDFDCTNCQVASGVTYHNNYHGDAHVAQEEPIVKFVRCAGLTISGNWWIIEAGAARAAITLDNCEGVSITANRANTVKNFVESTGATSRDVFIAANQTTAPRLVLQNAQIVGLNIFQAADYGNVLSGVASNGEARIDTEDFGVSFGRISRIGGHNSFARFGILDGSTGYLNRSLGYFPPSTNNAPHIFFTWDGARMRDRFSIGDKVVSSVPVIVPDEQFSEKWKTSNESVTKAAIYRIYKNQMADIESIVNELVEAKMNEKAIAAKKQ